MSDIKILNHTHPTTNHQEIKDENFQNNELKSIQSKRKKVINEKNKVSSNTLESSEINKYKETLQQSNKYIKIVTNISDSNKGPGIDTLSISPRILEKMMEDPRCEEKYLNMIKNMKSIKNILSDFKEQYKEEVISCGFSLDNIGSMRVWRYILSNNKSSLKEDENRKNIDSDEKKEDFLEELKKTELKKEEKKLELLEEQKIKEQKSVKLKKEQLEKEYKVKRKREDEIKKIIEEQFNCEMIDVDLVFFDGSFYCNDV